VKEKFVDRSGLTCSLARNTSEWERKRHENRPCRRIIWVIVGEGGGRRDGEQESIEPAQGASKLIFQMKIIYFLITEDF
jgi:hypothetical protein